MADESWIEREAAKLCACGGKLRVPCPLEQHQALVRAIRLGLEKAAKDMNEREHPQGEE
jgi:hypothetical protein